MNKSEDFQANVLSTQADVLENSDYDDFFKKAMKKFGISSPADLKSEEEKKKFFNYVW